MGTGHWEQGEESCLRRFRFRFLDMSVSSALADGGGRVEAQVVAFSKLAESCLCACILKPAPLCASRAG